ncbi:MAG: ABC transporter ATP-binding protein, partial [Anaerolineales bacterium]|nr:ABC transporter ATP-binding protein [Anaerolineales bacterium]
RVSALLELGAGFHPDLTGRENVFLNGSLLGLTRAEMEETFDDILQFSELDEFIDMPVKHYSSGMYMRLAFSVAIHVNPDILFIDEILAVGDQAFQNKCFDRIHALQRTNMTIVIVSHDLRSMQNLCERLIWINKGAKMADGDPREVLAQYLNFTREMEQKRMVREFGTADTQRRWGSGEVRIESLRFLDGDNQPSQQFASHDPVTIEIEYEADEPIENPQFMLNMFREDGIQVNSPNTQLAKVTTGVAHGRGLIRYEIERLSLLPAVYHLSAIVQDKQGVQTYDYHDKAYTFRVVYTTQPETHGLVSLPARWVVQEKEAVAETHVTRDT